MINNKNNNNNNNNTNNNNNSNNNNNKNNANKNNANNTTTSTITTTTTTNTNNNNSRIYYSSIFSSYSRRLHQATSGCHECLSIFWNTSSHKRCSCKPSSEFLRGTSSHKRSRKVHLSFRLPVEPRATSSSISHLST
ncbi:hypothetical protein M8J77_006251 [Diaphorina citri]|nr:hypothetical protein M8J77_006251 [Diaphorina citri]